MAGLDTSHVSAFARLLHDPADPHHLPGARITAGFAGGSPDFDLSISRVEGFTTELREKHQVEIVDTLAALRGKCDAVMLESVDGRVHLEQFREVSAWGVPVFIDKPLTISGKEARDLAALAGETGTRVASASALRFAEALTQALACGPVVGADLFGPMALLEKCPGYFWYGIHSAEMLFAALGRGCREVLAVREGDHDILVGRWADGRLGTLRGSRGANRSFGGVLHSEKSSTFFDVATSSKPYYASLLEQILPFFRGEPSAVPALEETVEIIRFLEAANESVATARWVALD